MAPIYEHSAAAADHNMLMMVIVISHTIKHNLANITKRLNPDLGMYRTYCVKWLRNMD
jgi:glutamine synthetase type III